MQLRWTDLADVDLEKIEHHIAADNGPIIAIDVVMKIIDSVYLILTEHPRAGRQGRVNNTRELVVDGLLFIVIYREQANAGVFDSMQEPYALVAHVRICAGGVG